MKQEKQLLSYILERKYSNINSRRLHMFHVYLELCRNHFMEWKMYWLR